MATSPSNPGRGRRRSSADSSHPASTGMVPGTEVMVELARRVSIAAKAPVVGGIAAVLHGCGRTTRDIDIYAEDFWRTHEQLEAAGYLWNSDRREHMTPEGVPVHMVGADELGGAPKRQSTIQGVKVISLADLVRAKLVSGLESARRAKDIADVLELIRIIPLKKDFAAKLPAKLRGPFKLLVDEVHGARRTPVRTLDLWK